MENRGPVEQSPNRLQRSVSPPVDFITRRKMQKQGVPEDALFTSKPRRKNTGNTVLAEFEMQKPVPVKDAPLAGGRSKAPLLTKKEWLLLRQRGVPGWD